MEARVKLQARDLKKSGHNKFSGYYYFELGDFLPAVQQIFHEVGLCGVVSFSKDYAELSIVDTEDGTLLTISSPMAAAELKGAHPIQQLGAVETYQRRYLWMAALELVEHDAIDAGISDSKSPAATRVTEKVAPVSTKGVDANPIPSPGVLQIPENVKNWSQAVIDATSVALDLCKSSDDVMSVYKVNRTVYDELKSKDPTTHENIMQLFKTMKESFK
jgi:hypothetical protein